jgi:acyl-coenzyme A synthetase/AMP-(fatty) acid ligase
METRLNFIDNDSGRSASAADLIRHCRERLSTYKCPTQIEFMKELPKALSRKILRTLRDDSTPAAPAREISGGDAE